MSNEELLAKAEQCALYNFDSVEMIECKHALFQEMMDALRADPAATAGSAGAMRLEGLLARLKAIPDEKVAGDDARTGITYGFLRDFIRAFAAALAAPQAQEAATPPSVDMTALAGRLADMIIMLDAPDAYRRDYIAAVCRATLSMVSRPPQAPIEKTGGSQS